MLQLNETFSGTGPTALAFFDKWPGARAGHYLIFEATQTEGTPEPEMSSVVQRFACEVLISQLPEKALPDLWESLTDLYHHWVLAPSLAPDLAALPSSKVTAKRGKTNLPPEIRLGE